MKTPDDKHPNERKDLYDVDADQPEVLREENPLLNGEKRRPSQAEGNRETVEETLEEKEDDEHKKNSRS